MKPLANHCKGQGYSDKLQPMLAGAGLEGVQSTFVGFSPDKYPANPNSGVVGFVVFSSVELRDAAITANRASMALMGTKFQIEGRVIQLFASFNRKFEATRARLRRQSR